MSNRKSSQETNHRQRARPANLQRIPHRWCEIIGFLTRLKSITLTNGAVAGLLVANAWLGVTGDAELGVVAVVSGSIVRALYAQVIES